MIKLKHLRLSVGPGTPDAHAMKQMSRLSITYSHSTPQSMGDQWWFWNCENVPEVLPAFLTDLKLDPAKVVGYGLSEDEAQKIEGNR